MNLRTMKYYLAVTREGNISAAAASLHVSQPALSRQIKDLEEELGVTLFERGSRKIRLTEEGMILRRRAEEMVRLMQMTESEILGARDNLSGEVHIGAGESLAFHHLSTVAGEIHRSYPKVRFTITSGDTADLTEQLDNGLIDVALIFTEYDRGLYQGIRLPQDDTLGLIVRKDNPLAKKKVISVSDLKNVPLIVPRAATGLLSSAPALGNLNIVAVYNLIYNASLFVEDGVGCAIGFDGLLNTTGDSLLRFIPLKNKLTQPASVIWKKYEVFSPAVNLFLDSVHSFKRIQDRQTNHPF